MEPLAEMRLMGYIEKKSGLLREPDFYYYLREVFIQPFRQNQAR